MTYDVIRPQCLNFQIHEIPYWKFCQYTELEQLERLHSEDTPTPPMPHDYPYIIESHWIPSQKKTESKLQIKRMCQIFKFLNKLYTRHTFWSCLIRCANMKWIWWVLLKIQSGHDSVHRRTDRRTDMVKPVCPPFNFVEAGGITRGQQYHIVGLVQDCSISIANVSNVPGTGDYKNPLHLDVVDWYLRRMGDETIPDEAPPSLESFYPPWVAGIDLPQSRCCGFFVSFTNKHKKGVF